MKYKFFLLFTILFLSCEEVLLEDLLSEFSDENTQPITTINQTAATYNSSSVIMNWTGNEYATSFSHRLEPLSYMDLVEIDTSWSDWDPINTVTFTNLDDGDYIFYIKSRYIVENEEVPQLVTFSVNAITGISLRMYPLYQQVTSGENFSMYIIIEDVVDLGGLELHLSYPPSTLTAISMITDTLLSNSSIFFDTINSDGTIELISTAADFTGFTGSGILAKINFTAGSSASLDTLHINDSSIIRNSGNVPIDILNRMYGLIEVVE